MKVSIDTGPQVDGIWDDYVAAHPGSSHYHQSAWLELIDKEFDQKTYKLTVWVEQKLCGVLPLVRLKSRLFGDFMVSMPYLNYGGALADDLDTRNALLDAAISLGQESGVSHIEFRDESAEMRGLPAREDKVAMILDLPADLDALGKSIGSKRRSQVRRPGRENPEIHIGGLELVPLFYRVFARNMRDLGTPVYSQSFFETICRYFPGDIKIVAITIHGEPAAAAFLIGHRNMLEIPWASTVRDYNRISINMLLYWEVLGFAIGKGYKQFDFGRSTIDAGTYRFKKQWGAEPKPLYWHYWLRDGGELPKINPDNPKYRFAIRAWQALPLAVANRLGPRLVRNLP